MRKKMPPMTESADALHQRRQQDKDLKKRQRLQALSRVASGHAHHRQEIAELLGVHRHSVAAWVEVDATGGLDPMLGYQVPRPPLRQRIPATALTALQETLQEPHGFAGSHQMRAWLAEEHQVTWAYARVHALGRYTLHAQPKRPRPAHAKKVPKPCPSSRPPSLRSAPRRAKSPRQSTRARSWPKLQPAWADCRSSGVA